MWGIALKLFSRRIGQYLGRAAKANPGFIDKLIARLRASGAKVGEGLQGIVSWVSNNKVNTILLSSTLASMGYGIAELFEGSNDPEVDEFVKAAQSLDVQGSARVIDVSDAASSLSPDVQSIIAQVVQASELSVLAIDSDRRVKDELLVQVLSWAKNHYGSINEAKRGHAMSQVFAELPASTVEHGFRTLKLS